LLPKGDVAIMICPKCFAVEKGDGLRCHKCGAQLQTGVFRQSLPPTGETTPPERTGADLSRGTSLIVLVVLVAVAIALLVVLAALDAPA
jgi:hypothetical protein